MLSPNSSATRVHNMAALIIACALFGPAHAADADRLAQLESRLEVSLRSIEQLAARVRELESRVDTAQSGASAGAVPVTPTQGDSNERLTTVERQISEMAAASAARHDDAGLPLHGFADVGAGTHNPVTPDLHGAAVGSLDFYLTPELGERTQALFELNFKVGTNGAVVADLERVQLGYQLADAATIWLGRFHTPYGYYNTAFHHGQQIATALRRPRVVQFETTGGVLPAHTVGLWLAGAQRMGVGKVTYDLYIGNAQRVTGGVINSNNAGNSHGHAIIGGNIGLLAGGALDGLRIGASAFTAKIEDDLMPSNMTRVNNYGLYAVYDTDRWENIAEFYAFDNDDLTGTSGTRRSDMSFVQIAYRAGQWTPYARYERAELDQADNYFAALRFGSSYHREALGLRFDLDLTSALKLEVAETHVTDRAPEEFDEALMQYAIRF